MLLEPVVLGLVHSADCRSTLIFNCLWGSSLFSSRTVCQFIPWL